jgi:flagellar motility protein MotE (MotC chaperone)
MLGSELDLSSTSKGQLKYSKKLNSLQTQDLYGIQLSSPFPTNINIYNRQPFEKKKPSNKYELSSDSEDEIEENQTPVKNELEVQNPTKFKIQTQMMNDLEVKRKQIVKKKIEEKRKQLEYQFKSQFEKSEEKLETILKQTQTEKEKKVEIFTKLHQLVFFIFFFLI